jgi:putative sterol carrier protein
MAVKFPSDEWCEEFARQINTSKVYEKAAKTWEGDLMIIVEADKVSSENYYIFLGLYHGKCTELSMIASEKAREVEYIIRGSYTTFRKCMEGKTNPVAAMMKRKIKLEGNLLNIARYPKAGLELINILSRVDTEFGD